MELRQQVLDASMENDSGNGDGVEDEGLVLEVTSVFKVTLVLTWRIGGKNKGHFWNLNIREYLTTNVESNRLSQATKINSSDELTILF